jgi:hypothetical protein
MVLIRMADQERIDIQPTLCVSRKPIPELFRYIESVVVRVIGRGTNVHVDQHLATALELHQRHIAVADRKKPQPCHHIRFTFPLGRRACALAAFRLIGYQKVCLL